MARQHFFYNITRSIITQFCDVFNDLKIARYNERGVITKYVNVPMKFAPKTKQWYWEELKANHDRRDTVLPIMSINLENISYDSNRQVNKFIKFSSHLTDTTTTTYFNPVPYNFEFSVKVYAEYMVDITQIIEQILPSFYPEAYIRITLPELNIVGSDPLNTSQTDKLELRVVFDGSQREATPELDEEAYRVLSWELNFTVQGYLFTPQGDYKIIRNILTNYYMSEESWNYRGEDNNLTIGHNGHASVQGDVYTIDNTQENAKYRHFEVE